ncbi:MAG: 4Fe-4S binding protein [Ignavibacteria bacterium]|jgi:polyferredoxin|nr:4Fe-4S binding protein [Ignavibacteria bacterium]
MSKKAIALFYLIFLFSTALPVYSIENSEFEDEFEEFIPYSDSSAQSSSACENCNGKDGDSYSDARFYKRLNITIFALTLTVISGFLLRFAPTRKLRFLILLISLIVLGFYNGACPCPISSMSQIFIYFAGAESHFVNMIWFLALIPITYIFGKVWCGWVCHLGALQEFIYSHKKIAFLESQKTQTILKYLRYFFTLALIVQLFIVPEYLCKKFDPFRLAFNLGYGASTLNWALLAILLLISVFSYRPFCKGVCPIGLFLGWVAKIPGASILGSSENCIGCNLALKSCDIQAISQIDNQKILDNKECIACGNCIDACPKSGMKFFRKSAARSEKQIICKK